MLLVDALHCLRRLDLLSGKIIMLNKTRGRLETNHMQSSGSQQESP